MYRIITELGDLPGMELTLEDAIERGRMNLPNYMTWEVRDENEEVVFTHYDDMEV